MLSKAIDIRVPREGCLQPQVLRGEYQSMSCTVEENLVGLCSEDRETEWTAGKSELE